MKLILAARDIPDSTIVYKVTGTTPYALKRKIKIYAESGLPVELDNEHGYVFLVGNTGNITAYNPNKEFRVDFDTIDDARDFLAAAASNEALRNSQ